MDFKTLRVVLDLSKYYLLAKKELCVEAGGSWKQEQAACGVKPVLCKLEGESQAG